MIKKIENYNLFLITILVFIIAGCSTLDVEAIKGIKKKKFDKSCLHASVDPYKLRVDVFRNTVDVRTGTEGAATEEMPYHTLGFDLGNGLFYDLNGNLGFLITELFGIKPGEGFKVVEKNKQNLFVNTVQYSFLDSVFTRDIVSGIGVSKRVLIKHGDSTVTINPGRINKEKYSRSSNGNVHFQKALENKYVKKTNDGYRIKGFLNSDRFIVRGQSILLRNHLKIENYSDKILVHRSGFGSINMLCQIVMSDSDVFVYNSRNTGIQIRKETNKIVIYKNKRIIKSYEIIKP